MKKALFTVSYAGLWGQKRLDVISCIHKAAELGFDGVLFMGKHPHLFPYDVDDKQIEDIKEALHTTDMEAVGVAAYNDFLVQGPPEVPLLAMQVAYIESCIRLAAQLGAPLVRLFTGYLQPNVQLFSAWKTVVTTLHRLGDYAQQYGVTLAVQNHHDLAVDSKEMYLLLQEIDHPAVRAGFDAWSPFLRNENLGAAGSMMAEKTAMTIVANYQRFPRYTYASEQVNYQRLAVDTVRATTMEKGEIDYHTFLDSLHTHGFDGWVIYEMCSPLIGGGDEANLDRHAKAFVEWMNENF